MFQCSHPQIAGEKTLADCKTCQFFKEMVRLPPNPFTGPVTRHLVYYIAPAAGSGTHVWRTNLKHLLERIDLFNGRRILSIAVGGPLIRQKMDNGRWVTVPLDPADAVREAVAGHGFEVYHVQHHPNLREVSGFAEALARVESQSPNEAVFWAHAKGVTHPVNPGVSVHRWTEMLYETCLDYWPLVEKMLQTHPVLGAFKKVGNYAFGGPQTRYHYSGGFYWMRSNVLFARNWRGVDRHWAGVEMYPDRVFSPEDAGCLFWEKSGTVDLYNLAYLQNTIEPALAQWKAENAQHHRKGGK